MSDNPPVVCVHGALRSSVGMLPTVRYLRRRGFDTRAFGYSTRRGTMRERGAALGAFVESWLGPRPPVVGILTHSMGGVVARAWLGHAGADQLGAVQRLAMLSPPNQGSALARQNLRNPLARMLYGSSLRELAGNPSDTIPELPRSAEVLILAGGNGNAGYNGRIDGDDDGVVAVDEMGLPGVEPTFVGGIHALLQWNPKFLLQAARFIAGGA